MSAHPLRIAINASIANQEIESGIVTWDHNIVKNLMAADDHNRYTLYTNGDARYDFLRSGPRSTNRNVRPSRWIFRPLSLASRGRLGSTLEQAIAVDLALSRPDVYFQTAHAPQPLFVPVPSVVMVFDVAYLMPKFQQFFEPDQLGRLQRNTARAVQRAAHVLALSENTKRDVATYYKVAPERITVVYPGVDTGIFHPVESDDVKKKYGLQQPYWIHVGALQPRKNVRRLLEAMRLLKSRGDLDHRLVLAGGSGWLEGVTRQAVKDLQLEQDVVFLGRVPTEEVPALMCGAVLLATPSLYEGFGLTVLEAMACGVPVLASNTSSLPEVGEGAAILLDPDDTEAWAGALEKVSSNSEVARQMREDGLRQATRFTWQKSAEKVLGVLEEVGAKPGQPKA